MLLKNSLYKLQIVFLLFTSIFLNAQSNFEISSPESQGFSSEKLTLLNQAMHSYVDNNELSAIQTAIVKNGKLIHFDSYGSSDISENNALKSDDIFRIASMTKPIVSLALMKLYEEGKFKLNDPVYKYIPEFKNLTVKKRKKTKPVKNHVKIIDLLRHSAGLNFKGPEDYRKVINMNLEEYTKDAAKTPLKFEPGTTWWYSSSTDICGYLIEVLSRQKLDVFLKKNIFDPLKMDDTSFELPKNKIDRLTTLYVVGENKELVSFDNKSNSPFKDKVILLNGSGGLLSTTEDYLKFSVMLLNNGSSNGEQIIKKSTLDLMKEDHSLGLKYKKLVFGKKKGFGLGFEVVKEDETKFGSKGTFGWGGMFGTYFRVDPKENMVYIYMTQSFETYKLKLADKFRGLVYDSIIE
ncbi:beta-lactamase family protein [Flavobacteriaceae bacterium]|nr:beta-lactamase family protein [Flavobacteriaceae bacterium]MDB4007133.1 beta-lactamase family protein [Flavobacteriaceae bacterium]MDB4130799.1 beta-lactamase family protein [Flavobacteriaceae bacterium]MDB4147957.1 beta-lactamase family protein [bacterium]